MSIRGYIVTCPLPVCSCAVPGSVLVVCRVEVWHILFVLISLYSVFNVQDVILDLVYY